jgi:leader peptidase (prepilin peptidase)/N-methyltransferase
MERLDGAGLLPAWLFPAAATALGLVLGSFANVCIHRLPLGQSVVWARSACPSCGHLVRARDNVPLLSWLLLGGRCRDCRQPIPGRYPLVEALTGGLFLALALVFGPGAGFAVMALFALMMLILFFTDLETMLLPDRVTLTGTAAGLLLAPANPLLDAPGAGLQAVGQAAAGAAAGAGLILLVMLGWRLYSSRRFGKDADPDLREGMGMGDLKMLMLIGAFVGLRQVFFVTFAAALAGSLVGLGLMARRRAGRFTALPFGTFLALAAVAAVFVGRPAVAWYLGLLGWRSAAPDAARSAAAPAAAPSGRVGDGGASDASCGARRAARATPTPCPRRPSWPGGTARATSRPATAATDPGRRRGRGLCWTRQPGAWGDPTAACSTWAAASAIWRRRPGAGAGR